MKTIGYIAAILLVAAGTVSCTKSEGTGPDLPFEGEYTFDITIPDAHVVESRGVPVPDGAIENLYVLVFDENRNFLSRTEAHPVGEPGKYQVRLAPTDPDLPAAKRRRYVHFICNYHWTGFSDAEQVGKHENEVVSTLSVTGGEVTYWQRVELPDGVVEDAFPSVIELLRNIVQVSVKNNSAAGAGTNPYLTDATFALGDYIDYGTVAPFNTASLMFEEGAVIESPYGIVREVQESDFVEAGNGDYWASPVICYERKNSTAGNPMYVIVKGTFSTDSRETYYKIDIIEQGQENLYDIIRNYHFKLDITEVTGPGTATLREAMNSPASNNLLYSIVLEKYTSISDGTSVLNVDYTEKTFVNAGAEFRLPYSFFPQIGGSENNASVQFRLEQDPARPVIDESISPTIERGAGKAYYSLVTAPVVPTYEIYTARLIVTGTGPYAELRRVIQLRLRAPSRFESLAVIPNPIPKTVGAEVDISFTLPASIRSSQFPMYIYFTAYNLSPNLAEGKDSDLVLDYQIPGRYRYRYRALGTGAHTVHFKTVSPAFTENLIVESDLFETRQIPIQTLP